MGVFDGLRSFFRPNVRILHAMGYGVSIGDMTAEELYRTQPNLRAIVSFLADNAAQIPLKVYERKANDDRPRVLDSTAAKLLRMPNPDMTPFEFKRWMYSDLLLFERFMMVVVPSSETDSGWEMRPIPASWIQGYEGTGPFSPDKVWVGAPGAAPLEIPRDKLILFHGYDPADPMRQVSRIESLKETLHEQIESNRFRRQMWQRGGRFNAYLTRPKDVQPWSDGAYDRFKETWKASWAGKDAGDGGGMPILEDGMEIKSVQFNSRDAQWSDSVKLSREDVAAVYHVNPAMVWPGSGQTYASAKDNARALYNDCLGPILMQPSDRLNMVLLPMVGEDPSHYIAYDITVKTEGTFEEKLQALQAAAGAPVITRNEARAKLDMPAIEGGDELVTPLNVLVGGLSGPTDTDPDRERYNAVDAARKSLGLGPVRRKARGEPVEGDRDAISDVYRKFFKRQAKSVLPKIGSNKNLARNTAKADGEPLWWDSERWNRELADDLFPAAMKVSAESGERAIDSLELPDEGGYDRKRTQAYVRKMCERRAEMVNQATLEEIEEALEEDESDALKSTPEGVFENAEENRSATAGAAFATALAAWGALEGCRQRAGSRKAMKTWVVTSSNPRSSHARMNGETVPVGDKFSNGADWPGDIDNLDVADVANCRCVLEITTD